MSAKNYRGVTNDRLRNQKDIRTGSQKFFDELTQKKAALIPAAAIATAFTPFLQNHAEAIMAGVALPATMAAMGIQPKLPFYTPSYATGNTEDDGFFFFGNELGTNKELWLTDSEARRHVLIMGTTGAGKTESIIGLLSNSLAQNSAFVLVDGKADTGLYAKVFSLCRRFGREDDLLVINYMVGTVKADLKRDKKLSNTLNPFAKDTGEALSELVTSLLPSGGSSDGIWKDRASVFITALIKALTTLRDDGHILLDVNVLREHLTLEKVVALSKDTRIPELYRAGLINYVVNIPGYQPDNGDDQEPTVYDQHGYVVMQFQPCFGMLSDTYGHIMKTQLADCTFKDIILQRRILVVLLPALEKSPSNLSNLGKCIISSLKGMMAAVLGAELEGLTEFTLDAKPTNGRTYQCCFDEYGYYSVEGAAVMPAQARGIGFSLIFAGQDFQAFKKGSADEAASIKANCMTKICMTLEETTETAEIFTKGAGMGLQAVERSVEKEAGLFGSRLLGSKTIEFEKVARVDELDLKDQKSGEFHMINMAVLVRGKGFYANPKQPKEMIVNSFIRVKPPEFEEIKRVRTSIKILTRKFEAFNPSAAKRIDSTWADNVDSESLDLTKAINFSDSGAMKQVAIAYALRKNKIDIVDNAMILKIKELEEHLNKEELADEDLYDDSFVIGDDAEHKTSLAEPKIHVKKSKQEIIDDEITQNEMTLAGMLDLDTNPISQMKAELDEISVDVSEVSSMIIQRWKDLGVLKLSSIFLEDNLQDRLAKKTTQESMIKAAEETVSVSEVNIDDLDDAPKALTDFVDGLDFEDMLGDEEL